MDGARHLILHYHFFKNGGSTLIGALKRNFGADFAELESVNHNDVLEPEELFAALHRCANLRAISSHTLRPLLAQPEGICFHEIFLFRHPLDRLRSMYDFYSAKGNSHPLAQQARTLGVSAFIKLLISDYPHLARNSQLRILAAGGARLARESDLDTARAMLQRASGVAIVEAYDFGMATIEHELRRHFPKVDLSYTRRNVSPQRSAALDVRLQQLQQDCGEHLYSELLKLNELDLQLLNIALAETKVRSARIDGFSSILRDFGRRVWVRAAAQEVLHAADWSHDFVKRRSNQLVELFCRGKAQTAPHDPRL